MATLTSVSAVARKGIKYGIIFLIVLMIIPVVSRAVRNWWDSTHPAPPAPPTVRYGKLPPLQFPKVDDPSVPEYKLETISGGLPTDIPITVKVYLAGINRSRLVSLDRIRGIAKTLGFTTSVVPLDEQNYKFSHQTLPAEILFNIITWQFAYRFDWTTDPQVYSTIGKEPQVNQAIGEARTYFQSIGLLSSDLSNGPVQTRYFIATGSAMLPTQSFYEANFTRVDLFRSEKDKLRVVTPGGVTDSPVNVTFSGLTGNRRVVQANYYYSMTNDSEFATYPTKPVQTAYDELVNGGGFISKRAGPKVIIRKVTLGYYESNDPQSFLQPIYIFEGDGGFLAVVQAVDNSYIQTEVVPTATPGPARLEDFPTETPAPSPQS